MKKIITSILFVALFAAFNANAAGAASELGDSLGKALNLFGGNAKVAKGKCSSERDILPVIFKAIEFNPTDDRVVGGFSFLKSADTETNTYTVFQSVSFAYGKSLQSQDSEFTITTDGTEFTVETTSFVSYLIDKSGKPTSNPQSMTESAKTKLNKMIAEEIEKDFAMSDEDFAKYEDIAYTNLDVFQGVATGAKNKLKAKKWFKDHDPVGKEGTFGFMVTNVDESSRKGFDYMVNGIYQPRKDDGFSSILIRYYTNNEDVINYDKNSIIEIKAKIEKIEFQETTKYRVDYVVLTD